MTQPLTFAAASKQVDRYISQFEEGYFPPLLMLARLTEETGEIARVLAHQNGKTPKAGEDVGDLELELADLLFVMLSMANAQGLSLERGFERMMTKVAVRDKDRWTRKQEAAHLQHDPLQHDRVRYPLGPMPMPQHLRPQERAAALQALRDLPAQLALAVADLSDAQLDTPYRSGGWTVRQVVHHLADSHANAYIRLKLALTEKSPTIKPYQQDQWAALADGALPLGPSLDMLSGLHGRMVTLLETLDEAQFARPWIHPDSGTWTVDTLLAMYAWHGQHHTAHIAGVKAVSGPL